MQTELCIIQKKSPSTNFLHAQYLIFRNKLVNVIFKEISETDIHLWNYCLMSILVATVLMAGFIGMALSYGLSLNVFLVFSVQNQCHLANMIVSVERLEQYMNIPSEPPEVIESNRPPLSWPAIGEVEICDLKVNLKSL